MFIRFWRLSVTLFINLSSECHFSIPVSGIKLQLQLQNTETFRNIGVAPRRGSLAGCRESELYSDDHLETLVRHQTLTGHHASGTCRMGAPGDGKAVVDPELR